MLDQIKNYIFEWRVLRNGLNKHMRVFSHSSPVERYALFQIAKALPRDARALEIGSHVGSSALFICSGLAHRNGHLVCVDTWMNQTMPDGKKDTFEEFKNNTEKFSKMIKPVRKFSYDLTTVDIGGFLDFVFIDGDHSEAGVRADFQLINPWVKSGGLVTFHDLRPEFPGVGIVIGEAMANGEWELVSLIDSLCTIRRLR